MCLFDLCTICNLMKFVLLFNLSYIVGGFFLPSVKTDLLLICNVLYFFVFIIYSTLEKCCVDECS